MRIVLPDWWKPSLVVCSRTGFKSDKYMSIGRHVLSLATIVVQ